MSAFGELLGAEADALIREAIERKAQEIVDYRHYNGSEAMEQFGLSRSDLRKLPQTFLTGRTKPVYLLKHIKSYKDKRTKLK